MKLSLVVLVAAALAAGPALAQTAPKAAAKPTAKSARKAPAPKPAPPPVEVPLPSANDEQKEAAALALLGDYACEFDQTVTVAVHPKAEGYLEMKHKAQTWAMKPVLSSTGALRLEDVRGRMLMIQIANKSMVLDAQIGQRLVDGCMHEKQREFAKTMASQPQEGILK